MSEYGRPNVRKSTLAQQGLEDDLRDTTIEERWNMMWQLALDAWAMKGEDVAEREFPRHVERLERRRR